jgi:hypothetical protein
MKNVKFCSEYNFCVGCAGNKMQQCWFNLPVKQQYRNVYQILRNFGALE